MIKVKKNIIRILIIMLVVLALLKTINVQATNIMDNATNEISTQAIEMFNMNFKSYLGTNVSATNVRSLIAAIRSSNTTNEEHKVWVNYEGNLPSNSEYSNSERYNVSVKSYDEGYISIISIEQSSSSSGDITPTTVSTPTSTISSGTIDSSPKVAQTPTVTQSKLPQTGISDYTGLIVAVIVLIGSVIFAYKKFKKYSDL